MEKVINITIGKVVFNIEEEAYQKLSDYLKDIQQHFAKEKNSEEIVEDIEVSIAEKFLKQKQKSVRAVTLDDVDKIIKQMGTVKDFEATVAPDVDESEASEGPKKLYRNGDDKIIAGVASGLAAYFGLETLLVRVIFVIAVFFGGLGAVVYIVLWAIVPEAKTTSQKLEMYGSRITLQEIEKNIKKGIDKIKKKDFSKTKKGLNRFFQILGKVVLVFFHIIRVLIGIGLLIAAVAAIMAMSFVISFLFSGTDIPYLGYQVHDFITVTGPMYWAFLASLYFAVIVPFVIFLLGAVSILRKKNAVKVAYVVILLVIWFVALGFLSSILLRNFEQIEGTVTEIVEMADGN